MPLFARIVVAIRTPAHSAKTRCTKVHLNYVQLRCTPNNALASRDDAHHQPTIKNARFIHAKHAVTTTLRQRASHFILAHSHTPKGFNKKQSRFLEICVSFAVHHILSVHAVVDICFGRFTRQIQYTFGRSRNWVASDFHFNAAICFSCIAYKPAWRTRCYSRMLWIGLNEHVSS